MPSKPNYSHGRSNHRKKSQGAKQIKLQFVNTNNWYTSAKKFDVEFDYAVKFIKSDSSFRLKISSGA